MPLKSMCMNLFLGSEACRGGSIAFALFLGNRFGIDWRTFQGMRWYDCLKTRLTGRNGKWCRQM